MSKNRFQKMKNEFKDIFEYYNVDPSANYQDIKNKWKQKHKEDNINAQRGDEKAKEKTQENNAYYEQVNSEEKFTKYKQIYGFLKNKETTGFGKERIQAEKELEEIVNLKRKQYNTEIEPMEAINDFMTDLFRENNYVSEVKEVETPEGKKRIRTPYGVINLYAALLKTESISPEEIINITNTVLPQTPMYGTLQEILDEDKFIDETYNLSKENRPENITIVKNKTIEIYLEMARYGIGDLNNNMKSESLLEKMSSIEGELENNNQRLKKILGKEFIEEVSEKIYQQLKEDFIAYTEMNNEEGIKGTIANMNIPGFFTEQNYVDRLKQEITEQTDLKETYKNKSKEMETIHQYMLNE